jgi:hypothetical protein
MERSMGRDVMITRHDNCEPAVHDVPIKQVGTAVHASCVEFLSIKELAQRWRCSRGTCYTKLRCAGTKLLDFAPRGKRGKKIVPLRAVLEMEDRRMKPLR